VFRSLTTFDPTDEEWVLIEAALDAHKVPPHLRAELRSKLVGSFAGLLLYGSWARGDAGSASDLDVLAVDFRGGVPSRGYHLSRDGVILLDPSGRLARVFAEIDPPEPNAVIERIRSLTPALDVSCRDRAEYVDGLTQVARYLLRSALYAQALAAGQPCFSVREIAQRSDEPDLETLLSSHEGVRPSADKAVLADLIRRLELAIGTLAPNPYGDIHGLIEGAWESQRELSNFATLALSDGTDELPYDELPKVTL
jgi:hypothetical protein